MATGNTFIIIAPGFAANEADTTCMPAQQLFVKALNRNMPDIQITILALQYPHFKGRYNWHGNEVISFNDQKKGVTHRIWFWMSIWRVLNNIYGTKKIMGILSLWCTETAFIGKYFALAHKLKYFIWILGQDARKPNKYIPLIRPKPDKLIALSDASAAEFSKNFGIMPAHVIPNGIEKRHSNEFNRHKDIDIMGAGNLVLLKQYDLFIKAVKTIKTQIPSIKAVLCGKGIEKQNLETLSQNMELNDTLIFKGETPHNEVRKIMARTKIFLHPSSYEGFSSACLEALYAGAHVISFTKPMKEDIKNWHIVKDEADMAAKALQLLSDENTEYEPVMVYSTDSAVKNIMDLYVTNVDTNRLIKN